MFLLFLLCACGDEQREAPRCPDLKFTPTGPVATQPCECPHGTVLFLCDEETCEGTAGVATCEPASTVSNWAFNRCYDCIPDFTDEGAFTAYCPDE